MICAMSKRVVVYLLQGETVASEEMEETQATAEFERILEEEPSLGPGRRTIRVGKSATFQAGDFDRIELEDSPGIAA